MPKKMTMGEVVREWQYLLKIEKTIASNAQVKVRRLSNENIVLLADNEDLRRQVGRLKQDLYEMSGRMERMESDPEVEDIELMYLGNGDRC